MELNLQNIDITKADLGLRHDYIPQTVFNKKQKEDEQIVVECEYLKIGEKVKYTTSDEDGKASIDLRKMFKEKVIEIRNLKINGKSVVSADELLKYPGALELEAIVIDVCAHLLNADSLNEEERKN
jgi:hypothetical protein